MKIVDYQVLQSGDQSQANSQSERSLQSIQIASDDLKPEAGEQVALSREARLKYKSEVLRNFEASSQVSYTNDVKASEAGFQFHQANIIERILQRQIEGIEAVQVIQSVGGESVQPLSGEVSIEFNEYQYYSQSQSASVAFSGQLKTEDGREIGFSLYLSMAQRQEYEFEENLTITRQALTDPLVLNFGIDSVQLSDTLFQFDIDADGTEETIANLASGSGFLALDRNSNGEIDDGAELFGARTGNGFSELAYFDQDDNGWIDENDEIFQQLQIMVVGVDGEQSLRSLQEMGVGAIYLGAENTAIDLADQSGRLMGAIKRTGFFFMERGEVKSIQEIDFADLRRIDTPEEPMSVVLARGAPLNNPEQGEAINTELAQANPWIERFAAIREQQNAFRDSLKDASESSEVSFIRQLFEQIEVATEKYNDKRSLAAEQYLNHR